MKDIGSTARSEPERLRLGGLNKEKFRIVLISPYLDVHVFGVRTLSACLKKEGHDVEIIFLRKYYMDRYEDEILDEVVKISRGADLIGISLMTNNFDNAVQITKRLKEDLDIPIIWGGIHPTIRPEECLDYADMVCMGEGEEALVELVRKMKNGENFHNVQGMWFKDKGNIIKNERRLLIQDLDSIPFPDYDYNTHYIFDGKSIRRMDEGLLQYYTAGNYITLPVRGCPFGCTYCVNNTLNKMYLGQNIVRKRSVDNIINELIQAKIKLPFINHVTFAEDTHFVAYTIEETRVFSEKYKKDVGLPLIVAGTTPSTLTKEKLSLFVDAGLIVIKMGIETGSECTQRLYKRSYSNEQIENAVKIINEFKDKIKLPVYFIILDNPWETDEDLIETLMFLAKLPTPFLLNLFSLTFFPGTELYEKARRDGIIIDDIKDVYRKSYLNCKKTYLNMLFFLLKEYVSIGGRISPKVMSLLTNRKLRQLRLIWLLYIILKVGTIPFKMRKFGYLVYEGLKDMLKGDFSRTIRYISYKVHPNRHLSEKAKLITTQKK